MKYQAQVSFITKNKAYMAGNIYLESDFESQEVINSYLAVGYIVEYSGGGGGTTDYDDLNNKPKINGVELSGNKTSEDLGITSVEEQIVGWTNITPNTYHEVDIRNALKNGKKKFTILIYMKKGENRQATKYELTNTELDKLFTKANANELVITRTIMGVDSTSRVAMLKQFVKQSYDTNNQLIPGLLKIKYQGYENNTVIGAFDNFTYTIYAE